MGRSFLKQTAEILRTKQRRKHLKRAMVSLSVIVAMLTSYLLILPAVTMERDPICGQEEHTHTDECYEHRLICGKTEQDGQAETTQRVLSCAFTTHVHSESCYNADGQLICGYADYAIHTHDENCYDADGNLVCTLPEVKEHGHDGSCYATETVLACGQDESSVQTIEESSDPFSDGTDVFGSGDNNVYVGDSEGGHTHTEECYETKYTLTCGKDEIIPHTHTAECYDENGNLVCGRLEIQEHQHDENCFMTVTTEAVEGHTHTDECYEDVLICDKAEHEHTEECYPQEEAEDDVAEGEVAEGDAEAADTEEAAAEETGEEVTGEEATAEEDAQEDVDTVEDVEASEEDADTAEETEAEEEEEDSDLVAMEPAVEYICGKEEHTHGEECWDEEGNLICGLEEHVHDETCLPEADDGEAEEEPVVAKVLTAEGSDYTVEVTYTDEAQIPDNAVLSVREIEQGTEEYESYYQQAVEAVQGGDTSSLAFARFFDISFVVDGTEIEPAAAVSVKISYKDAVEVPEGNEVKSVHFGEETEVLDVQTNGADGTVEEVEFDANGFSVYGIVGTTLTTHVLTADGRDYTITVKYGPKAEIPDGAELRAYEISSPSEYLSYVRKTAEIVFGSADADQMIPFARYFDISIVYNEQEIEPKEAVEVSISCDDLSKVTGDINVIHFADSGIEMLGTEYKEESIVFQQDSFSVEGFFEAQTASYASVRLMGSSDTDSSSGEGPVFEKTIDSNNDGTYTLSLNVTGASSSETKSNKADVIIVFDKSGSMDYPVDNVSESGRYGYILGNGYIQLYDKNGNQVTNGGTTGTVYYYSGWRRTQYEGPRYTANTGTKTRLDAAKTALNGTTGITGLVDSLLAKNGSGTVTKDNAKVTLSLVTFSNTASKEIIQSVDATSFKNAVSKIGADGGTNWEDGLTKANEISARENATKYVIFVSDGDPTFRNTRGGYKRGDSEDEWQSDYGAYGSGNSDNNGKNYKYALVQAKKVVSEGGKFYTVGVFGNVTKMQSLTTDAGSPSTYYQSADSQASLIAAFENIIKSITNSAQFEDVKMTDNITSLTATSLIAGTANNFTYKRSGGSYDANGEEWVDAPVASFDGTKVNWDLNGITLEDGVTYTVSFKVWPSQAAYDLVADLKNGVKNWDELTDEEKAQISIDDDSYLLKTNTDEGNTIVYTTVEEYSSIPDGATEASDGNSFTYNGKTYIKTSDSSGKTVYRYEKEGSGDFKNPSPIPLTGTTMKVSKIWADELQQHHLNEDGTPCYTVTYKVYRDGKEYGNPIELPVKESDGSYKKDENEHLIWEQEINIAPGLATTNSDGTLNILDEGHDYTVTESIESNDYYDFETETVRPMLIDSASDLRKFVKDDNGAFTIANNKYSVYNGAYGLSITGTNVLRGSINLYKIVNVEDGLTAPSTEFTFIANFKKGDTDITSAIMYQKKKLTDTTWGSGVQLSADGKVTLKADEQIRFINIPAGTDYSIKEELNNSLIYEFNKVEGTIEVPDGTTARGDGNFKTIDTTISGSIVANAENNIIFTNDYKGTQYTATKVWDDNSDKHGKRPTSITIELLRKVKDSSESPVAISEKEVIIGKDIDGTTISEDENTWTYTWIGLEKKNTDGKEYVYSFREKEVPDGYEATYSSDGSAVTNKYSISKIIIRKTDERGKDGNNYLSGAVFKLYKEDGTTEVSGLSGMSDSNGYVTPTSGIELKYGTYYLEETKAPAGYNLPAGKYKIIVSEDKVSLYTYNSGVAGGYSTNPKVFNIDENETITVYITNNAGVELPSTGGIGTLPYTLGGMILLVTALMYSFVLRRRRERRLR